MPQRPKRDSGPIRILWAARWEHDKNPEDFFEALKNLKANNVQFRLSVIGQSFREQPRVFEEAQDYFREHIDHWGYQRSRRDYESVLAQADVIVSTANHEFFGISIVEAISAGAYPVLPRRLSYPEILALAPTEAAEQFFYDSTVEHLANMLTELAGRIQTRDIWPDQLTPAILVDRFKWPNLTKTYDHALEQAQKAGD